MDDKLPKCGCGGEAGYEAEANSLYYMMCRKCHLRTAGWRSQNEARAAWTRAMSAPAPGMEAMMKWVADLTELCPRPIDDDNGTSDQCIERGHCGCNHAEARAALQGAERGKA